MLTIYKHTKEATSLIGGDNIGTQEVEVAGALGIETELFLEGRQSQRRANKGRVIPNHDRRPRGNCRNGIDAKVVYVLGGGSICMQRDRSSARGRIDMIQVE